MEQHVVEPKVKTLDEMRVSFEFESTVLPVLAERSKRPNTSKPTGRHNDFTNRAPRRNGPDAGGDRVHLPQNFGDALTAGHKVLNEDNESLLQHHDAVVVQDLHSLLDSMFRRKH